MKLQFVEWLERNYPNLYVDLTEEYMRYFDDYK